MKPFPIEKLIPIGSSMEARIEFNPFAKIPPSLWYGIGIRFENVIPDQETLFIDLDGIFLPERQWQKLSGTYRPEKRWENGSVYVDSVHNPVDLHALTFLRRQGNFFDVKAELYIDFAFEGAPYENTAVTLDFTTEFLGIKFREPNWSDPSSVKFPREWRIPHEFSQESVDELVSRFVDIDVYTKASENQTFSYAPKI
jgi:hypothetical protein